MADRDRFAPLRDRFAPLDVVIDVVIVSAVMRFYRGWFRGPVQFV
ncbi:MAG: hypothetical protein AAGG48_20345 [Planctomycetota bacterium]